MSVLERPDNHLPAVEPDTDGSWKFSCICGEFKTGFGNQKLANLVADRHMIIVGVTELE